ncbi:MAG: bifunctional nuclease family protein [Desulfovibrio sp.]|nr:bifunctional nuclease family protein [Desulfovibrio sp.]
MTEMMFKGLIVNAEKTSDRHTIVLQEVEGLRELRLELGSMESMALSLVMRPEKLPRPLTHDLLLLCLKGLHAQLAHVEITDFSDGMYYAVLEIHRGTKRLRIDCRPSDAITLALRNQRPIFVSEALLGQSSEQAKTHDDCIPLSTPDAATDMQRRTSADHLLHMLSADPERHKQSFENTPKENEKLLELLRCLEPSTRQKM